MMVTDGLALNDARSGVTLCFRFISAASASATFTGLG